MTNTAFNEAMRRVPPLPQVPSFIQGFFLAMLFGWITIYLFFIQKAVERKQGIKNNKFSSTLFWHDFHAVTVVILGSVSLYSYYDKASTGEWLSEYTPIAFTSAYFIVDLADCIIRKDVPFLIHASLSLILSLRCARDPLHFYNRSASRGIMTELSTFSLHKWQKSKSYIDFLTFFVLFTLCRIVWIPYFVYDIYNTYDGWWDSQQTGMMGIFLLNLTWWIKMVNILIHYKHPTEKVQEDVKKATLEYNGLINGQHGKSVRSKKERWLNWSNTVQEIQLVFWTCSECGYPFRISLHVDLSTCRTSCKNGGWNILLWWSALLCYAGIM